MELISLQKKTILIPTPGQTEQEYIGHILMTQKWALCVNQINFSLKDSIKDATYFDYQLPVFASSNLEIFIESFLQSL